MRVSESRCRQNQTSTRWRNGLFLPNESRYRREDAQGHGTLCDRYVKQGHTDLATVVVLQVGCRSIYRHLDDGRVGLDGRIGRGQILRYSTLSPRPANTDKTGMSMLPPGSGFKGDNQQYPQNNRVEHPKVNVGSEKELSNSVSSRNDSCTCTAAGTISANRCALLTYFSVSNANLWSSVFFPRYPPITAKLGARNTDYPPLCW